MATAVADAFLAGRSAAPEATVRAAYRQLGEQASAWFDRLTDRHRPRSVRVRFSACPRPYANAAELAAAVRIHGELEVTAARHDRDRPHPGFDTSTVGCAYDRLRAVHDVVSHGWLGFGFDRDGEFSAWCVEHTMYTGLARWALATELHAEHSVCWTTGTLAHHQVLLLDPHLLCPR